MITYTFTPTAGQCASTTTTQITVDPEIIPLFAPIGSVCQNTTAPVIPTSSLNIPPITGTWSPAVNTAILGTSIYTFTPSAGQCSTNATVSIAVTTSITPVFSAIASLCQNATAPVLSTSSINSPPIVGTWSPAVDVSVPATTTYTFTPAIGQCATIATLNIVVNPYPTLFVFPPAAVCYPAEVDLTLQEVTAGSTGTIYYSASSTGLPHLGNPSAISVSGTYYIISENNFGCEVILPIDVVVEPSPLAEFIPTPSTLNLYNLSSTMENNSVGGDSYQWFFMDGGTSAEINPTHIFPDSIFGEQLITLIVTSLNGCKDTTQKVVIINDELIFYVPNTFTPDGDTYNQTFQPIFTSGYDPLVFSMLIYNRWGEVVFETNDASRGWAGTFGENGNMAQEGVYTWKIEFKTNKKDKHQLVTGSVNILR
jgi:gliding motility-associated-like protein